MAINQKKYIDIMSGVGGASSASNRELIARLLTSNTMVPTQKVVEFTSSSEVSELFGENAPETVFATKYFSWISKNVTRANKISFARFVKTSVAPTIISTINANQASVFEGISSGSMMLKIGETELEITSIDFTGVTSLANVASIIKTKINSTGTTTAFTGANVEFINGAFIFTGGEVASISIDYAKDAKSGIPIASLLGWDIASNPVVSYGAMIETPTECASRTAEISNNFGSFKFVDILEMEDIVKVSSWNEEQNVMYVYSVSVSPSNYADFHTVLKGKTGTCLTLSPIGNDYAYMPMAVGATIDYNRANSTVNFMFMQFPDESPNVITNADSNKYDALSINYLGSTQQSGKPLNFYQRGSMMGDIKDIGVYYNEIWLKDSIVTACFNLFLSIGKVPANSAGASIFLGSFVTIFNSALSNGTILAGKILTPTQKAYIDLQLNRVEAWRDVQTDGYVYNAVVESKLVGEVTEYQLKYLLIYSKGDSIKKVEGTHILI